MATKYNMQDDVHYGYSSDMTSFAATLDTSKATLKYFNYTDKNLYVWTGTEFVAM